MNIFSRNPDFPFKPSKFPFFYGWVVLFAGTIGVLISIPGQTMGVSVFTDYLIDALDLSRVQLSFAYLLGTLSSAFLLTKAGKMYDKIGARFVAIVAALILGIALVVLSQIDYIALFFSDLMPFIPAKAFAFVAIMIGFFVIRFSGQGVLTLASRNMVMKWFDKRRGLANGIKGIMVSFGFSFAPPIYDSLINDYSWRGAWMVLAAITGIGFVLFALLFFRDSPDECACKADGNLPPPKRLQKKENDLPQKNFALKEARRSYNFWVFNLALAMFALYVTSMTFHVVSIFEMADMSRKDAVAIFLPASFIAVFFNMGSSWLSDFIKLKYLLFVLHIGLLISMIAIILLGSSPWVVWMLIVGNGISGGTFGVLSNVCWPRFFGTKHLGAISGYSMGWIVAGSAVGPYIFSLSLQHYGSYSLVAFILAVVTAVLLLLSFRAD